MAAAVIKFDPLADPVWTTAQNDHLFAIRRAGFAFHVAHDGGFIGGIHVRCLGFKLGSAGVDTFETGDYAKVLACIAHVVLIAASQFGQTGIGEAHHLKMTQAMFCLGQAVFCNDSFCVHDLADTREEPWVEFGDRKDVIVRQAVTHRLGDNADTVWRLFGQLFGDRRDCGRAGDVDFVKTSQASFHRRERLLHRFVECPANCHHFTHGFHGGGQVRFRACEFLKSKARNFGDDIVDCRLE